MKRRYLVGICTDSTTFGVHLSHVAGDKYVSAVVEGAQALGMLIPSLGSKQSPHEILANLDGLLLPGSYSNVQPRLYDCVDSPPGALQDVARDATALPLICAAVDAGIPVLAICRGFQEMNVAFGGWTATISKSGVATIILSGSSESKAA